MRVEFFGVRPEEKSYLEGKIPVDCSFSADIISPEKLPDQSRSDGLCVFIDSTVNGAVMDRFPNLKFIATRSTGYDHIDLAEAKKRGIAVSTVPSYGENTVAEFAFGLILALSRKIYSAADQVKETGSFAIEGLRGFDLLGKTIGIVGTGRIGRHSIKIAKGFGMDVIAYDPFPNEASAKELGFKYVSMDQLLKDSDIVTLHVPYSKETHHLIDAGALSKMKPTSIIINTSRGGIIDTDALTNALRDKKIAGAGLDVLEEEGAVKDEVAFLEKNHPDAAELRTILEDDALERMPNVIVTP
ncbi:MAG: hydroxyacid dehydrogenase, partial [Patescibacteria group bacterium]|nr:hydroxyacid dehydrogenase [Patescibacteria group bacterium]